MFFLGLLTLFFSSQVWGFDLKPNDVVLFMGDSNTEHGSYHKIVESNVHKVLKEVRFINAGVSGSNAWEGVAELMRVLKKKPTVVFVTYGINDIGWGNDQSEFTRKLHIQSILTITQNLLSRGIRVIVQTYFMTAFPTDGKTSAVAGEVTATSSSYLQLLGNDVMTVAQFLGAETIDLQSYMREKAALSSEPYTRSDGVHLNRLGNEWAAEAILRFISN